MTYSVFGATLNLALSIYLSSKLYETLCLGESMVKVNFMEMGTKERNNYAVNDTVESSLPSMFSCYQCNYRTE